MRREIDTRSHWESVYATRPETEVSWYQEEPTLSLQLIRGIAPDRDARIIDVGGGASVLVDRLMSAGYRSLGVLDISEAALDLARSRRGKAADRVQWLRADITQTESLGNWDVWHDRAVFHFLTSAADQAHYVALAERTLPPGGHLIMATFAPEGPEKCSGLPVCRYDARALAARLGASFRLLQEAEETHRTPAGATQAFTYGVFRRVDPSASGQQGA